MSQNFKPVTVGISGGSASGKTTLATALAEELKEFSPVILHQDYYFRDWSEYSPEKREKMITANHPDCSSVGGTAWAYPSASRTSAD